MAATLKLESALDALDLNEIARTGKGVQALVGTNGFGLPPVAGQWQEGVGDGSAWRGQRTLARDIDLPLLLDGGTRSGLQVLVSRLAKMLAGECTLRLVESPTDDWSVKVRRVGGGEYAFGPQVGEKDMQLVVTLRAGDPYFVHNTELSVTKTTGFGTGGELTTVDSKGDVDSFPVWTITGPGFNFRAESALGEVLEWRGNLSAGQTIVIDTRAGTVLVPEVKNATTGVVTTAAINRFSDLAPAPRMWKLPPGTHKAKVTMSGTGGGSSVKLAWHPRKWMVI